MSVYFIFNYVWGVIYCLFMEDVDIQLATSQFKVIGQLNIPSLEYNIRKQYSHLFGINYLNLFS